MSGSFHRIDYSLRPAKHAERRMLCDIFRRLRPFGSIEEYLYVGFGSVWFSDFSLFHRALGIKDMLSIEKEKAAEQRINDNRPFRIPIDFRPSGQALPDVNWAKNVFLWLDYDDPISTDILADMRTVARCAGSGSVVAISVQCSKAPQAAQAESDQEENAPTALQRFITAFGRERVGPEVTEEDLLSWQYGTLSRNLVLHEIEATLSRRNSAGGDEMLFRSVSEIEYQDGAKMTTLVGVFYKASDQGKFDACEFDTLDFSSNENPVRINVPKLTVREFKRLESQLPLAEQETLALGAIPESEAKYFAEFYRYLPKFAVLEG